MIITYGTAKTELAQYVNSGSCPDSPSTLNRINHAMMRLIMCDDWRIAVQKMRFVVSNDHITLPSFVQSIYKCRSACGRSSHVFDSYYEFMEAGPGQNDYNGNPDHDLVDLGDNFPTFHEIPTDRPMRLVAFSKDQVDSNLMLNVRGETAGREHLSNGVAGVDLPINVWRLGVEGMIDYDAITTSPLLFREITQVIKPLTTGFISLLGIDDTTKEVWNLGVYHPFDTYPGYRRYKVVNQSCGNPASLVAMCRMRYVPMRHDNDPLIIQNIPAIIAMLQSMNQQDAGNITAADSHEQVALRWLSRQSKLMDDGQHMLDVTMHEFGSGDIYQMN